MTKRKRPIKHVTREDFPLLMARSVVRGSVTVRRPGDLYLGLDDEPELVHPADVEKLNKQARSAADIRGRYEALQALALVEDALADLMACHQWDEAGVKQLQALRRAARRLRTQAESA